MILIPNLRKYVSARVTKELHPATLANSLFSGLLIYLLEVIFVISFTALAFSGQMASQLPRALGFILLGNALLVGLTALLSSYPGSIGVAQDTPGAVLGVVATAIVTALPAVAVEQQFATVVMMVAITTLITGILFLALGMFKLGGLVRFLPYPVMGGFLAGTGWLLAKGGVGIMAGKAFGTDLLEPQTLLHWLPGLVFGLLIFGIVSRVRRSLALPVLLVLGTIGFYLVALILDFSPAQLEAEGWLTGSIPASSVSNFPLSPEILSQVNWEVLGEQLPNLVPVAFISVIALLLNCGGLELVIKKDIDLNRELITAGAGNLFAGALGGLVGYHTISLSSLNHKLSGGKRLVGLCIALLLVGTIFLGAPVLGYLPKSILGAVLVYLGVSLLVEWVYLAWFKFPRVDFAIIVVILITIILSGFLSGIILGLVLATILFVVSYSRLNTIKFALAGGEYHSRVTRSWQQQQQLEAQSEQIFLFKLQGFIFFGTANSIFSRVREQAATGTADRLRFVLLDFTLVTGLDSTGLLSFSRILQWGQQQEIVLVLTGLKEQMQAQFARAGFHDQANRLRFFSDLDHGIEWCEDQIMAEATPLEAAKSSLLRELKAIAGEDDNVEKLLAYMHCREYSSGEYLIRQDDKPDTIYFIESGQVTAQREVTDQIPVRLETMGGGRLVGELGFYLGIKRTAAVVVNEAGVIYSFSKEELTNIEKTDPEVANLFHRIVVHLLGERVVHLLKVVETLER